MNIRLWSGGESCTAPSTDNMTSIVEFIELPSNASSYEFTNINLQVCGTILDILLQRNNNETLSGFTNLLTVCRNILVDSSLLLKLFEIFT